ncbi:MAG TPA: orotidine-5'-phosphate decarboxylase, partial [Candidatus Poseidoniaceae archaeon]
MQPGEVWGNRWSNAVLPMARRYMEVATQKQSLVCLAADRNTMSGLMELVNEVGPYIAALKTHVDLVDDWSPEAWEGFCEAAKQHNLLIFEDRKFADIGKITKNQMSGIYDIRSWSDIVTAHLISGPDIVDGLQSAWQDVNREGGVLLLAQMSSRGNLLTEEYCGKVVEKGIQSDGVLGFIGNGSRPDELKELRLRVGEQKM